MSRYLFCRRLSSIRREWHDGEYKCQVSNICGEKFGTATVSVMGDAPRVQSKCGKKGFVNHIALDYHCTSSSSYVYCSPHIPISTLSSSLIPFVATFSPTCLLHFYVPLILSLLRSSLIPLLTPLLSHSSPYSAPLSFLSSLNSSLVYPLSSSLYASVLSFHPPSSSPSSTFLHHPLPTLPLPTKMFCGLTVEGDLLTPLIFGESREYVCRATGQPAPSVVWSFGSRRLDSDHGRLRY